MAKTKPLDELLKDYIKEDLNKLTLQELKKAYKFVRKLLTELP